VTERSLSETRRWARQGNDVLLTALGSLADAELAAPSGLDGWSRRHLLAHVALNAEALGRLVTWARTGVRRDMYASSDQRDADIQSYARRPAAYLRSWVASSAAELNNAWDELTSVQWSQEVITAQGRSVPARVLPWLRAREACLHALDLDAGVTPDDIPLGFWSSLIEDVADWRSARGDGPSLDLRASDSVDRWSVTGTGPRIAVEATTYGLASWLAGRNELPDAPRLTRWL
jgi:maleylpyruvate isomerase